MVHDVSQSHRGIRKRSKKCRAYYSSNSASNEELNNSSSSSSSNNSSVNGTNNSCWDSCNTSKVQIREQVASLYLPIRQILPTGFDERLCQLLAKEMAYHPRTDYLFNIAACEDKVDAGMRDEAIFNLRFLHKFHNLAPECFAHAVNMTDRFLARVKVKPKYMACLTTAAYLIAAKMIEKPESWPAPGKLVRMARCGGSPSDLERMEAIIRVKLRAAVVANGNGGHSNNNNNSNGVGGCDGLESAVTPLHFLALLRPLFPCERSYERAIGDLETCLCSAAIYCFRPAQLALCVAAPYLTDLWDQGLLDQLLQLLELNLADLPPCASAVEAESRRIRSRRRTLSSDTWPGLRSCRYRRLPLAAAHQLRPLHQYASCPGLDTIREERLDDDCCLLDICQLFR